jgi:hypothetical protein
MSRFWSRPLSQPTLTQSLVYDAACRPFLPEGSRSTKNRTRDVPPVGPGAGLTWPKPEPAATALRATAFIFSALGRSLSGCHSRAYGSRSAEVIVARQ